MKVYIADILSNTINGKSTGHYFAVAHNYLSILGEKCVVAGGPIYKNEFESCSLLELPHNIVAKDSSIKNRIKTFVNARALFQRAANNVIVLQQCTTITTFLCILLFYHNKGRLFFIQYSLEGLRNKPGRLLYRLAKHKINGIICPNNEVGKAYGISYCVVPDYIYTLDDANANIAYEKKKFDFCMIGRISPEKGIVEAAKALSKTEYKVLIAGRPQTESLSTELHSICDEAANIRLLTDFISVHDFESYLKDSRYAILNYQGEYAKRSSGVVYDTIFAGVPVVGRRCEALQFIEDFGMGYLFDNIDEFDPKSLLNKEEYEEFRKKIVEYRYTHKEYIERLKNYLLGR